MILLTWLGACVPELAFAYDTFYWETDLNHTACQIAYLPEGYLTESGGLPQVDTAVPTGTTDTGAGPAPLDPNLPPEPYFGAKCIGADCTCFRDNVALSTFRDTGFCAFVAKWVDAQVATSEAHISQKVSRSCGF